MCLLEIDSNSPCIININLYFLIEFCHTLSVGHVHEACKFQISQHLDSHAFKLIGSNVLLSIIVE